MHQWGNNLCTLQWSRNSPRFGQWLDQVGLCAWPHWWNEKVPTASGIHWHGHIGICDWEKNLEQMKHMICLSEWSFSGINLMHSLRWNTLSSQLLGNCERCTSYCNCNAIIKTKVEVETHTNTRNPPSKMNSSVILVIISIVTSQETEFSKEKITQKIACCHSRVVRIPCQIQHHSVLQRLPVFVVGNLVWLWWQHFGQQNVLKPRRWNANCRSKGNNFVNATANHCCCSCCQPFEPLFETGENKLYINNWANLELRGYWWYSVIFQF